jgi:hypothetical protein
MVSPFADEETEMQRRQVTSLETTLAEVQWGLVRQYDFRAIPFGGFF